MAKQTINDDRMFFLILMNIAMVNKFNIVPSTTSVGVHANLNPRKKSIISYFVILFSIVLLLFFFLKEFFLN